jgi:hypothetical protein
VKPDWQEQAACQGVDTEVFFPPYRTRTAYDEARAICAECPVLSTCRETNDAQENNGEPLHIFGMFAGETPDERINRRGRRIPEQRKVILCGTTQGLRRHVRCGEKPCAACNKAYALYQATFRARRAERDAAKSI